MTPYFDTAEIVAIIFVILFYLAFLFAVHLLYAFGPYRMAKHAGIPHAWIGLFPIGTSWLVGLLAERSLYTCNGRRFRMALWTPALWGIGTCGALMILGLALMDADFSGLVVAAILLTLVGWVAGAVLSYYALYYLFKDYAPDNAVLYTVLGIFFNIHFIFLLMEMNTVPVSVAGPGPFPYGRPKYDRWHRWSPASAPGYGVPQGSYPPPQGGAPYNGQPYGQPPYNGGPGYSGQGPQFYNSGYSQPPAPPQGPSGGDGSFYQGSGYYQQPAPPPESPREEGPKNGPEL